MFDFTLHNEDTTAVSNRVTVTPKTEYENIFNVTKVKYKIIDYDYVAKKWVEQFSDELLWPDSTIIADIESLSDDYASAEGLEIGILKNEDGYLFIDEQSTGDLLMKYETWNYEGGMLNISQPGFTTENRYSLTDDKDGNEYTDKININKRSDGVYEITWGEADLPANEYTITYLDSDWNPKTKNLFVYKCPVYPVVENTEQKYNPSGNAITITSNGTKCLDNAKLKVDYYPVDEESGTLSSLTPVSQVTKPGKYMYVISVDDSAADNYEILFRYVPKGKDIPDFRAFDNVGFFTVTQKEADIMPQTNAVHTYDGGAYDVSGLFTVDPVAGDKVYSMVKDSETTGEGTLSGNMLTVTKSGTFKIKLNTAETDKCLSGEAMASLTVKKGTPDTVVYPTASDVTYGDTLAQSTLTGGSTNGSFKWKSESTLPTVNNRGYEVVFTPADGDLYDYSGVNLTDTISVKVNPLKVIIEWLGTDGLVYDEETKTVSARVANAVLGDTPNLTLGGDYSAIQVGGYTAAVTGVDNPNYTLDGVEASKTWYISKGTNSFTSELIVTDRTYGDTAVIPSVSVKFGTPYYLYSDKPDGVFTNEIPQNAGTYYVKAAVDGTTDYAELISDNAAEFKIEPKSIAEAVLSAKNSLKYNGQPQKQEIEFSLNGFTEVTYDISDDTETDVNQNGSYKLKVTATGNFTGSKELEWNIEKADLTENTSKPTTARVRKNGTLADAEITEGEMLGIGNVVIDGSFSWDNPSTIIKSSGTAKMKFTPSDGNYNEKIIDVSVNAYSLSSGGSSITRYTVKFDTNGGNSITSQTVTRNSKANEPTNPAKEGYVFNGWYTDSEFTSEYDFNTKVTKNITLYAKWSEEEIQEPATDDWKNPFTDVKENDWFFESVKYANKNGLMNGTTNTTFSPNESLTRGMLAAILYRAEGEPAVNKSIPFSDVNAGMYYANAIIWAQQNDIVNGVSETEFAPDENITREQIATIIYRYAKANGYDVSIGENTNILSYTDFDEISEYAIEAMQYSVGSGLIQGKTETTLNPKDFATRAEIAAILQRFIDGNK